MTSLWSSSLRPGVAFRWVLMLAVLWAGLLAPGVMPGHGPDGSLVFVLCTGEGERLATLDADGQPVPIGEPGSSGDSDRQAAMPCAFAVAHAPVSPPQGLLWTLPDGTAVAAEAPAVTITPAPLRLALADHLPRGPPAA